VRLKTRVIAKGRRTTEHSRVQADEFIQQNEAGQTKKAPGSVADKLSWKSFVAMTG